MLADVVTLRSSGARAGVAFNGALQAAAGTLSAGAWQCVADLLFGYALVCATLARGKLLGTLALLV